MSEEAQKEINRLRAALEFIAGHACPPHGLEKNCVKDRLNCHDCLKECAKEALEGER